ncbi:MAG TPA: hypothetical protein VG389_13585 [Myxococcota bacterium]|jgi:hypothetical protein|nr:hypothetical protein [Myxococcota bacterium]
MRSAGRWERCWALVLGAVAAGMLGSGCQKGVHFDVSDDIPPTNVDGDPLLNQAGEVLPVVPLGPFAFSFDLEAELQAHNAGPAQEINLTEMNIAVTDGLGDNDDDLAWLSEVHVFVESTMAGTELPRTEIAARSDFPDGFASLPLNVNEEIDLLPYVEEGMMITSEADGIVPPDDVQVGGDLTVTITALAL